MQNLELVWECPCCLTIFSVLTEEENYHPYQTQQECPVCSYNLYEDDENPKVLTHYPPYKKDTSLFLGIITILTVCDLLLLYFTLFK